MFSKITLCLNQDEHWNRFKGNVGETSERRGGAYVGFPECIDTILNWTELKLNQEEEEEELEQKNDSPAKGIVIDTWVCDVCVAHQIQQEVRSWPQTVAYQSIGAGSWLDAAIDRLIGDACCREWWDEVDIRIFKTSPVERKN